MKVLKLRIKEDTSLLFKILNSKFKRDEPLYPNRLFILIHTELAEVLDYNVDDWTNERRIKIGYGEEPEDYIYEDRFDEIKGFIFDINMPKWFLD